MPNHSSNRGLAFVYAATIFVSAFLLFQIQPMISKAILPWFGGTPAVWTVCLLFFQSILFAGYAYAHFTNAWLRPRQQAVLHILVIIAALALIALTRVLPDSSWQPRGDADPTRAILVILAITIGLPYFVLSATGPLLQAWFARSFPGRAPYRLYALSNIGSLLALLGYPFLFELQFDLPRQASIWMIGFIAFAILCALAAWRVRTVDPSPSGRGQGEGALGRVPADDASPIPEPQAVAGLETPTDTPPEEPRPHYFLWLFFPAFASIVLMATTNHISTDVAVVPLLWVVPLALYLLTFIIAFDRPAWYWPTLTAAITLVAIYVTAAISTKHNVGKLNLYDCGMSGRCAKMVADFFTTDTETDDQDEETPDSTGPRIPIDFRFALAANFAAMFGVCMLCHGQLARLKPPTRYLTAYYLMIAAGGAIGGIAVSLVAPHVFRTILEWKIATFAAAVGTVAVILSAAVRRAVGPMPDPSQPMPETAGSLLPKLLLVVLLAPIAIMMLDMVEYLFQAPKDAVFQSRNFFGTLTIRDENADNDHGHEFTLLNGTTIHGSQFVNPERRPLPTTYYGKYSGVGRVLDYFHQNRPPGGVRIGDVGLGAGTLAAYALKHDTICFYEINPTVVDIATNGKWFTYYSDARARGAHCDIRLGDARLTLERELEEIKAKKQVPYHVLVLDAFSGDAVPTHLLTAEAMDIYLPHLATEANMGVDGALLIHVSNRYLNLECVAQGAADYLKLEAVQVHSPGVDNLSINSADWVVLTRNKDLLKRLKEEAGPPEEDEGPPILWTDAHSSLFEILR